MLKEGDAAPAFSLRGDDGVVHKLSDFGGKKVVVYFYPKDDTPGCTVEACSFRDSMSDIVSRGAAVIGISRDSQDSHRKFKSKYKLNFLLLSDEDGSVCKKYGVLVEKNMYGRKSMGIQRSTFVIDEKGIIKKIFPRVNPEGHSEEVARYL
ncbi:MAG: thioredoxin-dependent thiol peroxidase [Candidatus Thermoplasmatota archaeon]|jgi:peroxiredoxin Q/BCP|nr:thioredoxin-dependent thiol peroxidase [Candidatus Thermoplasmatota archaeon]